jgi:hypothetical protein
MKNKSYFVQILLVMWWAIRKRWDWILTGRKE